MGIASDATDPRVSGGAEPRARNAQHPSALPSFGRPGELQFSPLLCNHAGTETVEVVTTWGTRLFLFTLFFKIKRKSRDGLVMGVW